MYTPTMTKTNNKPAAPKFIECACCGEVWSAAESTQGVCSVCVRFGAPAPRKPAAD